MRQCTPPSTLARVNAETGRRFGAAYKANTKTSIMLAFLLSGPKESGLFRSEGQDMKNKSKQNSKGFDKDFDDNNILIDFSQSTHTDGLSKVIKLAPLTIPAWLNAEIESIAQMQANSKS